MAKAILISVGGTQAPLIETLRQAGDDLEYVIAFVSHQTKEDVVSLIEHIEKRPKGLDYIITPSAETLDECYRVLRDQLPQKLTNWGIRADELLVDYTGGTKTMSAALVLATIEMGCEYSYVGGVERDKGGIGVVVDGKEKMWYVRNPWTEMAVEERRRANLLFNSGRYAGAREVLEDICSKVPEAHKAWYELWAGIVHGYELWDRFQHKQAHMQLEKGLRQLKLVAASDAKVQDQLKEIEDNVLFLRELEKGKDRNKLLVYDLIANARRRADMECRYDDAVARLYRAIEKAAHSRLGQLGINASKVAADQLPDSIRDQFVEKYAGSEGVVKLPLFASYIVLNELNDDLGKNFMTVYESSIKGLLNTRNQSILAHGDQAVGKDTYTKLLETVKDFMKIEESRLPGFPQLNL